MPTTGVGFRRLVDIKTDYAYTGYFDNVKMNDLVKQATVYWIDNLYATNDRTRIKDDLFGLTKTGAVFNPTANQINIITDISDYGHLLEMKCYFRQPLKVTITASTNSTPIKISLAGQNNIRSGEQLLISGVVGNGSTNGYRFVDMLNSYQANLYLDQALTLPVPGTGVYVSGGTVQRIIGTWAQEYDQKISVLGSADVYNPKYEVANQAIKVYPDNIVCENIAMDYVARPQSYIDVTDNVTDIELTYSIRMINDIVSKTAQLMGDDNRDMSQIQIASNELMQK